MNFLITFVYGTFLGRKSKEAWPGEAGTAPSVLSLKPRAGILSIDSHHPLTEILTILCYILCLLTETTRKCDDFLDCRRVSFCRATDVVRRLDFHLHGQH